MHSKTILNGYHLKSQFQQFVNVFHFVYSFRRSKNYNINYYTYFVFNLIGDILSWPVGNKIIQQYIYFCTQPHRHIKYIKDIVHN